MPKHYKLKDMIKPVKKKNTKPKPKSKGAKYVFTVTPPIVTGKQ